MKCQQADSKAKILVLNGDRLVRKSLYEMLCRSGYSVDTAESLEEALTYLQESPRRVILTDIDETGSELLNLLTEKKSPSQIIITTSYGNRKSASECKKIGAFDYLLLPVEDEKIIDAVEKALTKILSSAKECAFIKESPETKKTYYGLVGNSRKMRDIYLLIDRIANTKATVLLRGESGTGKRMIAHAIHKANRYRKDKVFVELSCGALPREIIESELFGHTRGAFTGAIAERKGRFELAHGGTMLLDDIDSFSLDLQVKLLRVLQQREFERVGDNKTIKVDVRIIVSTNQNLEKCISDGKFREDLYCRLNVISINIPPLRERKEDLPLLLQHFIEFYSKENYKKIKGASKEVQNILLNYNWPGNVRELENIIERAVILDIDNFIDEDDLPEVILNGAKIVDAAQDMDYQKGFASLKDALKKPEKIYILKILQEVGWNKKKAARKLGINRTTLYNKLRRYNLLSKNS